MSTESAEARYEQIRKMAGVRADLRGAFQATLLHNSLRNLRLRAVWLIGRAVRPVGAWNLSEPSDVLEFIKDGKRGSARGEG